MGITILSACAKAINLIKCKFFKIKIFFKNFTPFSITPYTERSILVKYRNKRWIVNDYDFLFELPYYVLFKKRNTLSYKELISNQQATNIFFYETSYAFTDLDGVRLNFTDFLNRYNSKIVDFVSDSNEVMNLTLEADLQKDIRYLGGLNFRNDGQYQLFDKFIVDMSFAFQSNNGQATLYFTRINKSIPRLISSNGGGGNFVQLWERDKLSIFAEHHYEISTELYEKIIRVVSLCSKYGLPKDKIGIFLDYPPLFLYTNYHTRVEERWLYSRCEHNLLFKYLFEVIINIVPVYPGRRLLGKLIMTLRR